MDQTVNQGEEFFTIMLYNGIYIELYYNETQEYICMNIYSPYTDKSYYVNFSNSDIKRIDLNMNCLTIQIYELMIYKIKNMLENKFIFDFADLKISYMFDTYDDIVNQWKTVSLCADLHP
jgi:hypothetical protein